MYGFAGMNENRFFHIEVADCRRKALYFVWDRDPEPLEHKPCLFVKFPSPARRKEKPLVSEVLEMRIGYSGTGRIGIRILVSDHINDFRLLHEFEVLSYMESLWIAHSQVLNLPHNRKVVKSHSF